MTHAPQRGTGASSSMDSKVWIRGHVIAGNSTTAYAEKYSRKAALYGASIVSG